MSIAPTPTATAVITVCAQNRNTVPETGAGGTLAGRRHSPSEDSTGPVAERPE